MSPMCGAARRPGDEVTMGVDKVSAYVGSSKNLKELMVRIGNCRGAGFEGGVEVGVWGSGVRV